MDGQSARIAAHVRWPQASAVVFLVDGLSQAVLDRLLGAGELPNVHRHFVHGGVEIRNAISCLPPLTYANIPSLLTGAFPARHGILGHQWFDPMALDAADYGRFSTYRHADRHLRGRTIYEILADRFTLSAQCHTRRGASHIIDQDVSSGIRWGLGRYTDVDRSVGDLLPRIARVVNRAGRWPSLWLNYFPGVDEVGHRHGPDSAHYAAAVRNCDVQIGRILAATWTWVTAGGPEPATCLFSILATDHGMVASPPARRWDPAAWLRSHRGLSVASDGDVFRLGGAISDRALRTDAIVFRGSHRCLRIHVRPRAGWGRPPVPEEVERVVSGREPGDLPLWRVPAIELVCTRADGGAVRVRTRWGEFRVECDALTRRRYRVVLSGAAGENHAAETNGRLDPELVHRWSEYGWREEREWLRLSAESTHPDFVPQISELLRSPRSGDILAFAAEDWSFEPRAGGGHGAALAADMRTSMFVTGPGIPGGGTVRCARLVDLVPTVLDMLGESQRIRANEDLDGQSILDELRGASAGGANESVGVVCWSPSQQSPH